MSGPVPNRWLRSFFHPSHAIDQINPDMTFSGSLGFGARQVLWLPVTVEHLAATVIYGGLLVILIGYPLHWLWFVAKLVRERRERCAH